MIKIRDASSGERPVEPEIRMTLEELTDPLEIAKAKARQADSDRNWEAFLKFVGEVPDSCRGKHLCVSGGEVFVADTAEEAIQRAKAAHPLDQARLVHYIFREKLGRIYANRRRVVPA